MTESPLPHKVATLLYIFNEADEVLLLHRTREPNAGLWSPPGGKVETNKGESPYQGAVREAYEEVGMNLDVPDLHLTGLISEHAYEGAGHWLMFLFEVKRKLNKLPPPHPEGEFAFVPRERLDGLPHPITDRTTLWPYFWKYRTGFFSLNCRYLGANEYQWQEEETINPSMGSFDPRAK
ncbi:MAG: NUDIX domain-containing protein [Verrucomicrobiota bacterium]|nr:NUDIX domain-containing protein [Verrucomicrobiota bacterium]